ncbi:unnamed protein product [Cylicocyclus nassatus]|uniref:EGF-like domain-containing protein n=1 Tax=Cylicocyclus nassatus TaxID=53992 RepID=A0AA36GUY8_CYLNA|nr:unnamed protein product [Cylicocyclus nassatus]
MIVDRSYCPFRCFDRGVCYQDFGSVFCICYEATENKFCEDTSANHPAEASAISGFSIAATIFFLLLLAYAVWRRYKEWNQSRVISRHARGHATPPAPREEPQAPPAYSPRTVEPSAPPLETAI